MAKFSEVLAQRTLESIKGTASGLVEGTKQAIIPGFIQTASKFIDEVKKEVEESNKKEEEEQKKQTKEEKKQSQYLGDSNKWLEQLAKDSRTMREKIARDDKFAEEVNNEKRLLDEKMLSTLEDIRDSLAGDTQKGPSRGGRGSNVPTGEGGGDTNIIGGILGRGGPRPPGSPGFMSRLLTGLKGFGAGALRYGGMGLSMLKGNPWIAAATLLASGVSYALTRDEKDKFKIPGGKPGKGAGGGRSGVNEFGEDPVKYAETVSQKSGISVDVLKTKKFSEFSEADQTKILEGMEQAEGGKPGQRNVRNNNPGNITIPSVRNAEGKLEVSESGKKWLKTLEAYGAEVAPIGDSDPLIYAKFPSRDKGLMAARDMLLGKFGDTYKDKTVFQQIETWLGAKPSSQKDAKPASPAGAQQAANRQGVATAQQNRDAAQEEANRRLREIGEASNRLKETEKNLKTVDTAYQVQKETYDSLSKKAKLTPEEQAKRDAAFKRMQDLNFESESLKALRKTQEDELENAQRTSIQAGKASDQAASVLLNQRQVTSEQNAVLEAEKQKEKAEKEKTTREQIAAEYARRVAAAQAREGKFQPITNLVGVDREGRSLTETIKIPESALPTAPTTPVARSIANAPLVAGANTAATTALALTGNLDFGQSLFYTPPQASGTDVQRFEAKTTTDLMLEYLKKIEQNTSKLEKGQTEANKNADVARKAPGKVTQGTTLSTKRELSEQEKRQLYFDNQFQRLINSTGNITKNLISRELNKLFFPGGQVGVSRDQGKQLGFLSGVAGRELKLGQRSTEFLSSIFGKKIGRAYGGVTGQALGLGIEKFALGVGDQLGFGGVKKGGIFGDYQTFNIGQILGNFAGNKKQRKLAREQLIYNFTGIPTGSDTLLRTADRYFNLGIVGENGKISFDKLADKGGKFVSDGLSSLFGFPIKGAPGAARPAPATVTKINPETGETYQALAEPGAAPTASPQQGIFGGFFDRLFGRGPSGTAVPNAPRQISQREQNAFLEANGELPQQLETTNATLADQSTKKDDQGFFGGMIDSIAGLGRSFMSIFTGAGGGSGGFGGGGFGGGGGGGGFFDNLMNLGGNLLTSYATYKLAGGLTKNIKNPQTRMIANLVLGESIKYGIKQFAIPAIQSAISGTAAAESLVAASPWLAGKLGITGAQIGATTSAPINAALIESAAASGAGGAGAAAAGAAGAGAAGAGAGGAATGMGAAAGEALAAEAAITSAAGTGGTAAGASTMLAEMGAFLANPVTIAALFVLAGVAMMSKGGTPHYSGFSKTKGSGFDRTWHADDKHISAEYTRVTDPLAMSAKNILDKHAANVGSTDKFEVAIAIGSDNEDPSYSIYQIYKNGTVIYDSGQEWGLPISFPDAVKAFVDKRLNGPLVEAMKSVSMTDAQKTALGNVSDYTTTGQISDFVQKGSTDASLLTPTYAGVTAENAGYEDISYGGGGESGNDTTTVTPMVWSMKDKAFVPIKETVTATGTSTDDNGNAQTYSYQAVDRTVLGYDENGNPIRAADLNKKVGTATAASGVTSGTVTTGGTASAAPASGGTTGASTATVTTDTTTPVTDYYNQTQESLNQAMDTIATGGAGNNTSIVAPTNVVDNSVRTSTTIVNTNTRNNDPVLFRSSRRAAFVD